MRYPSTVMLFAALVLCNPVRSSAQTFVDVPTDYWAYSFIESLVARGITSGCGGGNYCPEAPVTRAQMAVFLERGMRGGDFQPAAATGNLFLDVGAQDFGASFIEQLFLDGITAGCGNNNYCPDADVSRAQMAVFLLRAKYGAGFSPRPPNGVFGDVLSNYWAASWIEDLAADGITSGCGGGNFCPESVVTRAQMAVFLVRTFSALPVYGLPEPIAAIAPFGSSADGQVIGPWLAEAVDLNGDGLEDFVASKLAGPFGQPGPALTPLVALNDGQGSYIDATTQVLADPAPGFFLVRDMLFEDFNGDGKTDIYFSNHGLEYDIGNGEFPCEKNGLLLSGPDGRLYDVSTTHLPDLQDFSHGSSAADIDGDDDVDIWVNNLGCNDGPPSYLLENDGDGRFTVVANGPAFIQGPMPPELVGPNGRLPQDYVNSSWATFLDADGDGDEDLYLAINNIEATQAVLINDGSGAFEFAPSGFIPDPLLPGVQDAIAVDLTNDGRKDLIVYQSPDSGPGGYTLQLLVSQPSGGFADETTARLPAQTNQQDGAGFPQFRLGDLNGDGHLDILVKLFTNDFSDTITDFYLNDGTGNFRRLPDWSFANVTPGFLSIDATNDGYDDFVIPGQPEFGEPQFLLIRAQP